MATKNDDLLPCSEPELMYLFPYYIIGEVSPEDRKKIEEHLETCLRCRRDMQFFTKLQEVGEEYFGKRGGV